MNWKKEWIKFVKEEMCPARCGHLRWKLKDLIKDLLDKQKKEIWHMLFTSYPEDMENFNTMTEDQAYRLLKTFWNKLNILNK